MIKLISLPKSKPYKLFKEFYKQSISLNQPNVEAISISSFDFKKKEVDSRFVNLKYIKDDKWTFFTNYNSAKASQFLQHDQISVVIFWQTINLQIRLKAKIHKLEHKENQIYFKNRAFEKNALSISSHQSEQIESYENVVKKYNKSLNSDNLFDCPNYWGGYSFVL